MAFVHHVHVLERGHVATLCCTNSRAFLVTYFFLFSFLERSVLFSPSNMHVRLLISSQEMNTAEYCAPVKNMASWLVQPLAGAVGSKWGVSHQSSEWDGPLGVVRVCHEAIGQFWWIPGRFGQGGRARLRQPV